MVRRRSDVRRCRSSASASCSSSSSRFERPELFLQLGCRKAPPFEVTDAAVKKGGSLLAATRHRDLHYLCRPGLAALLARAQPGAAERTFAQIVIVAKDLEARERIKARLEKALADGALPEARARVDRFNFGPPVGFPVQFRVIGPDP